MNNPLLDYEFLNRLMETRQRETYARITLLTQDELPIEYIEGRVTSGSINVDGNSALRRTCNLTMILKNPKEVNQFHWTFKSKFKLEIGVKNNINKLYPDIIWFKQGIFILTTCNMNQTTNNYTITINGKDKMCLLNGDCGGNILYSTDFGVEEYLDRETNIVTYTKLLLKDIIRNIVQTYGGEKAENIIINDLDEAGLELLEYRGQNEDGSEMPLYLLRNIEDGQVEQITLDTQLQVCIVTGSEDENVSSNMNISDQELTYIYTSNLFQDDFPTTASTVYLYDNDKKVPITTDKYNIIKLTYGDLAGYRLTDLVYAGELKANIGETLVSVLDKISKMLSSFEYFYNLDGKFVFQKKHTYVSTPWGGVEEDKNNGINETLNDSKAKINLTDAKLVTAFANNPNLLNVKNDFSVWGTYKSISGADIPIHMRYALDTKPTYYKSLSGVEYTIENWDWREIIYQMAVDYYADSNWTKDDFCLRVAAANPTHYPFGKTGYEQYYTDIQGFWRNLYDPDPESTWDEIGASEVTVDNESSVYIDGYYKIIDLQWDDEKEKYNYEPSQLYVIQENEITTTDGTTNIKKVFQPFIGTIGLCCLKEDTEYYYYTGTKYESTKDPNILNTKRIEDLFQKISSDSDVKKPVVNICLDNWINNTDENKPALWVKQEGKIKLSELDNDSKIIYQGVIKGTDGFYIEDHTYLQYLTRWSFLDNYGNLAMDSKDNKIPMETTDRLSYMVENANGDYDENHWHKSVKEDPSMLYFWFDFLELDESSNLYKYSVRQIGQRTKGVNDTNVKSIYYRDVPNVIFVQDLADQTYKRQSGYTYIQLPSGYESLFSISGRGKSAKERVDELLQEHSYAIEQTNITTVPLYHLEPNIRVSVKDEMSNVDGEYIITKVTVPLTHNGTMSLSTNKVVSNIM